MSYSIFPRLFRQISRKQKHELEDWVRNNEQRTLDFDQQIM